MRGIVKILLLLAGIVATAVVARAETYTVNLVSGSNYTRGEANCIMFYGEPGIQSKEFTQEQYDANERISIVITPAIGKYVDYFAVSDTQNGEITRITCLKGSWNVYVVNLQDVAGKYLRAVWKDDGSVVSSMMTYSTESYITTVDNGDGTYAAFITPIQDNCNIGSSSASVGTYLFDKSGVLQGNRDKVTDIYIAEGVNGLGSNLFTGMSITTVTIPSSVNTINADAFNCEKLNKVFFTGGEEPLYIAEGAFRGTAIESVTLPRNSRCDGNPFTDCGSLKRINIEEDMEGAMATDSYVVSNDASGKPALQWVFGDKVEGDTFVVPEGVMYINGGAFKGSKIKTIEVASTVNEIRAGAFEGCENLEEVYMKRTEGLTSITRAFNKADYSSGDVMVYVPSVLYGNYCNVGNYEPMVEAGKIKSWYTAEVTSTDNVAVDIPEMLPKGKEFSIVSPYGDKRALVIIKDKTGAVEARYVATSTEGKSYVMGGGDIIVSVERLTAGGYKDKDGTMWYFKEGEDGVLHLYNTDGIKESFNATDGGASFTTYYTANSVVLDEGSAYLGANALEGLSDMESVSFPLSVIVAGGNVFKGCSSLKRFDVEEGHYYLTAIDGIDDKGEAVEKSVLRREWSIVGTAIGNEKLSKIVVPEGVTDIYDGAFAGAVALKQIVLPETVSQIGEGAFDSQVPLEVDVLNKDYKVADGLFGEGEVTVNVFAKAAEAWNKKYQGTNVTIVTKYYEIESEAGEGVESIDVSGYATEGETVSVKVGTEKAVEKGYRLSVVVSMNGEEVEVSKKADAEGEWTFEMPKGDVKVSAAVEHVEYHVEGPEEVDGGSYTIDKTTAYYGDEVTVTATPAEGYETEEIAVESNPGGEAIEVSAAGKFTMPESDVRVSVSFKAIEYRVVVRDGKGGIVEVNATATVGETVVLDVLADDGYEVAHVYVDGEEIGAPYQFTMKAADAEVTAVFRATLSEATSAEDPETKEVTMTAKNDAALVEVINVMSDEKSEYYKSAGIEIGEDIEFEKADVDLEVQDDASIRGEVVEIKTIESLGQNIEGNGKKIVNMAATMTGLVKTIEETAAVNSLVFDAATIYIDPTSEEWTEREDSIFVHILAKTNKGNINNFGFAGRVVVDESKVPAGKTVVVCIVGENEGDINGFIYDTDLIGSSDEGNKRCITIKQNIGCAKNGGRAKVATSKASGNKTLGRFINKMEREFTAREFASGEVAYWLNWSEQGYTGEYRPIWRQGKDYPELAIDVDGESNGLYKIEYAVNDEEKITANPVYANNGDRITIRYTERPMSIRHGDEEVEIGDESATMVYSANKSIEVEFAGTTGEKRIAIGGNGDGDGAWYDMMGRRQVGKPNVRGLYIRDGKIVVVR